MSQSSSSLYPRLRPIDVRPVSHGGRPAFVLRDPLQISDKLLIVPQPLGAVLALCDGTNDGDSIRAAVGLPSSVPRSLDVVGQLLDALDDALLLDNARFAEARAAALDDYRCAPFRPLSHAEAVYPADPGELRAMLCEYLDAAAYVSPLDGGRGIFSPHIDYARGGPVYANVWKRAASLINDADLVVLLATDHYGEEGTLTLTRQHYATPFGVLPTDQGVVDALAEAIGEEAAFAGELRHRIEHAVELVAVWVHMLRDGRPVPLVPVLCGSFAHFVRGEAAPKDDPTLDAAITALRRATAGRSVAYVVSGDLAHVGPAFGGRRVDTAGRINVRAADNDLIGHMCAGDADRFFASVQRVGDRNNICGLPPGYLALRALGATAGELIAYEQCPADEDDTSFVSVCGIVFA
jgi:hypothetical protein